MSEVSPDLLQNRILESIPFGFIQVELSGKIIYANKSAFEILQLSEEELLGSFYYDLPWKQFNEEKKPLKDEDHTFYQALNEKTQKTVVIALEIHDELRWFSFNTSPIYDENNILTGAISNFVDITEKVRLEENLKLDADRQKLLLENLNAVVWESEVGTSTFTFIDAKVEDLFGYPRKDWFQDDFWQSKIHPDDRQRVIEFEKRVERDHQIEYRLIDSKGDSRWVIDYVKMVKNSTGPDLLRGLIVDITDKKDASLKIQESRERYESLIQEAPYAITIYNKEGLLITANSKCEEYWKLPIDEYVGTFNIFESDFLSAEKITNRIKQAFQGEAGEATTTIALPHFNNLERSFRIKYYPLFDSKGDLDNVVFITEDITDYVEAEQSSREEQTLKQGILDALGDAILVVDSQGKILNINKSLLEYLKKQPIKGLKVGAWIFDFIDGLSEKDFLKSAFESILNRESRFFDHEMKLNDGKWYNLRVTPLVGHYGAVISWQNINTRKEIEMALEKSLKKYRNIYNKAPVMMHSINSNGEIVSVSDYWLEKLGFERNEVIGRSPGDFLTEKSRKRIGDNIRMLFEKGEVKNVEYQYRKKSGEVMDVLLSAVAEYDEDGKFERSITGMIDITNQKVAERNLQESQDKLLESQRISKIGNYEFDIEEGLFTPSAEMTMIMGFGENDRHVSIIEKLIHPNDLEEFKRKLYVSIAKGTDFFHVYRIFHLKTRKVKWISGRGKVIKDSRGISTKMIGTVQDISEQRAAEEKIRRLTDRVLLATEIANLGVWEYDRETNEMFWEDQMYSIFPMFNEPVGLNTISNLFVEDDKGVIEDNLKLMRTGLNFLEGEVRVEIEGEIKYLRSFTRVLRNDNGKQKGMVGVVYDITADKRLQEELTGSLDEKNLLIKEVHHRVKNNMQLISSIMALKSYDLKDDESKMIFEEVNNRIKAMSVIHDKLYTFYNVSEIDLSEYLTNIAQELQVLLGTNRVQIKVSAEEVVMNVDRALLIGLIVSELVSNAIKHSLKASAEGKIDILFSEDDGANTLIVLNDGEKIPLDALTKKTGLGVSLIKTFAKQLSGEVEVDKRNGFRIRF